MSNLWMNTTNGIVSCENHAGGYLSDAINRFPNRASHRTPLGDWVLVNDDDRAEWLRDFNEPLCCETCKAAA